MISISSVPVLQSFHLEVCACVYVCEGEREEREREISEQNYVEMIKNIKE